MWTFFDADESADKFLDSFLALTFEATTIWAVLDAISWEAAINSSNLPWKWFTDKNMLK